MNKRIHHFLIAAAILILMMNTGVLSIHAAERTTVKVGLFPFAGYHEKSADGEMTGYGFDILQQMLVYEDWQYEYCGYDENISWSEAQKMLDSGELDMLTSATMSTERLEKYDYSSIPIGTSSTILTVRAGDNRFDTDDYSEWNGLRLGLLVNNSRNDSFARYAKEHEFTYQSLEYETPDELKTALADGKLDMIVTSNLLMLSGVRQVDQFDAKPFYVIVKKGNTGLLKEVNDALEEISEQNPNFAEDLYKKYYEAESNGVVSYTRAEQDFIDTCNKNGVVFKAIVNTDRKPIAYLSDGEVQGLVVDLSKMIFERTGLHIEFEAQQDRDQYLRALQNREADIVCDFTNTQSSASNLGYVVTAPFYNSSVAMLVRQGYDGKGTVCALTKKSITNSVVTGKRGIQYDYYDTNKECQDAVLNGNADFTYSYTRTIQEVVYSDVTHKLACITVPDLSVDFKMAVNLKDSAYLSSILSKSVNAVSDADISFISEPYTYYDRNNVNLLSVIYDYPLIVITVVFFIAVIVIVLVLLHISRNRHQEEMRINQRLSAALKEASLANEAKTSFLSRVSHDMRTPLNGILGITTLLKDKVTDAEQRKDLEQLQISGEYLLNLVNDTLDVSRIENEQFELHPEVCDGQVVLNNILSLIQPALKEKHIQFTLEENDALARIFYVDTVRIQQVFMNVLSNAIKFTGAGGAIEMTIQRLAEQEDKCTIAVTVRDSGVGMSKDFIPHIFEPFSQADGSKKNAFEGTGLGMTITKQIIELMDGSIQIESEPLKGTTVMFSLQSKFASPEQITQWNDPISACKSADGLKGRRVLLCEDHPLNEMVARRLLESRGILVEHAENGKIGVALFAKSEPGYYDAILMDIRMPEMDGIEATQEIRRLKHKDAGTIPIIAMTANAFHEDIQECMNAGMNAHLGKPIEPKLLFEELEKYMKERTADAT